MKKIFILFIFYILLPVDTYATSGACSYHGGVNCSAGASYTGKVQCNDGWINSSVYLSEASECKIIQLSRCAYPSSWSSCKTEADYSQLESHISLSQIRTGTSFNSENNTQALKECRDSINSYTAIISSYNQCMITEYSYNPETSTVLEVKPSNAELVEKQKKEERQAFIDEAFQKYFTLAINSMPEYKDIVNPSVIKELSLKSENSNKTFPQLIIETYSDKLPTKVNLLENKEATTSASTSQNTVIASSSLIIKMTKAEYKAKYNVPILAKTNVESVEKVAPPKGSTVELNLNKVDNSTLVQPLQNTQEQKIVKWYKNTVSHLISWFKFSN